MKWCMQWFLLFPLIFPVRRPFWYAILDFNTYILTVVCVKYTMYHIRPKQVTTHQNGSLRMINLQIIGVLRIWRPSWTLSWKLYFLHGQILVIFWYVIKHIWNYIKPLRKLLWYFFQGQSIYAANYLCWRRRIYSNVMIFKETAML